MMTGNISNYKLFDVNSQSSGEYDHNPVNKFLGHHVCFEVVLDSQGVKLMYDAFIPLL